MKALQQPHPVLMMLGLNVLWSITLVASKVGINQFPPLLFSTLRFAVFAPPLLPFLRWYPGQMRFLLTAALLSGGVAVALLSTGIKYSGNISATAIATQLTVPFHDTAVDLAARRGGALAPLDRDHHLFAWDEHPQLRSAHVRP